MIRVMAFMGVFLLSIIGLLLLQPGERQAFATSGGLGVTRGNAETMLSTTRIAESIAQPDVVAAIVPAPAAKQDRFNQLAALQQATAASLSKQAMTPAKGDMRALTSSVLAGLRANGPKTENNKGHLASLVSRSMGAAGDDPFLSALAREAKYGTAEYDKLAMVGAERDTTDVKLRWIENARRKSTAMADATAFMSSGTKKTPGFDDTVHIVKRGDSLMKLSIRYYGRTIDYQLIFEANRDVLASPDKIRVGQQLKIPPMTSA